MMPSLFKGQARSSLSFVSQLLSKGQTRTCITFGILLFAFNLFKGQTRSYMQFVSNCYEKKEVAGKDVG